MIPILCLAALTATADPAIPEPRDDAAPKVIFIAPMGISIPINRHGLAFMVDAPNVAIDLFEPDARIDLAPLAPLATLSEIVHLHDVTITRTGTLAAVTLNLPRFPILEGQFKVRDLTIRPDGAIEFIVATVKDAGVSILLTQDRDTNLVTMQPADNAAARALTLTNEGGAIRVHIAPAID